MEAPAEWGEGIGDAVADADAALTLVASAVLGDGVLAGASDDGLLRVLARAARLGRLVDAVLVEAAGEVRARCDRAVRADRLSTTRGCRDVNELIRRATRCSAHRAAQLQRAAVGVRQPVSPTSGGPLPPAYPAFRAVLANGDVAAEAVSGVFQVLDDALPAGAGAQRLAADAELAAAAAGAAPDGSSGGQPPAGCDDLRLQAQVWAMMLDPDGAEPRDEQAQRRRGVRLGGVRDGLVRLYGDVLPDVAAQLQRLFDAIENPKVRGPVFVPDGVADGPDAGSHAVGCGDLDAGPRAVGRGEAAPAVGTPLTESDRRTVPQRHHDSLAAILLAAAGSADTPTLGGAAPTLTVAVTAAHLTSGCGVAHIDGIDEPVPVSVARHTACVGRVECTTFDASGRILAIHVHDRLFTSYQRRAIALRDGGCVIPGCHVRASWCEVHHVQEWSRGGPTHTDDGVLLCWFHHRTIDTAGWSIRMRYGVPEIRSPAWWDPAQKWRCANRHPGRVRPARERRPGSASRPGSGRQPGSGRRLPDSVPRQNLWSRQGSGLRSDPAPPSDSGRRSDSGPREGPDSPE